MILPPRIVLRVSAAGGVAVRDLIFQMTLTTGRRNPYVILFPKSDERGISDLCANDIRGQFTDHWEAGLMDHSGTIEQAFQQVQVSLFDVASFRSSVKLQLAWPLLKHEATVWNSRQQHVDYLLSCKNEEFVFPQCTKEIPSDPDATLELRVQHVA
jgi:hypothetical protein